MTVKELVEAFDRFIEYVINWEFVDDCIKDDLIKESEEDELRN